MSYVRKKTSHPSAMGGFDESESMYSGGKRRKSRASKRRVNKRAGVAIKAKAPGITTDRKHSFGKGHKF